MKKKFVLIAAGILLLAALLPLPSHLKDGGTVEYRALLYSVSKVHRLNDLDAEDPFRKGTVVKVLGMELYNDVE